ncbi:extracellular solute-binding protein [Mediterraneibacter sp. NSJ-55]|uniref:Extracellular solute-binding protein n=1 Tax=Mediterraneibacter hominis TaxID=2763054 RepID=A0A923LIB3_9FIRM|nr:extracellular solute-binding protein [Mediterraneibacter hominis]MBC5689275.1 extracellular solute-binding protein [Mediterraneibacter hominis]
MKWKRICSVALATALTFSLAACGSSGSSDKAESKADDGSVKITYLSRYTNPEDARAKFFMDKLEEFKELHPEIEIEDISVTDAEAYMSKMKSLIAAGSVPDVFACSYEMPRYDLAKNETIANIEPILEASDWTGPTDRKYFVGYEFEEEGLDGVYGVPNNLATIQMFINTKVFEDLGLEIPQTWEDLEEVSDTLIENGITPVGLSAKNKPKCVQFFTMLGVKMYGMEFQKKFADGTIDWKDEEVKGVLDQYKEWVDKGIFGENAISYAFENVMADFEQGKVATMFEMSYQFAKISSMSNSADITCVNVFPFEDKMEYKGIWFTDYYDGMCIGAKEGTPEYDAAVELFKFMLSQETFNQYAQVMGGGAYPLEVEFDDSSASNVMKDFMEAYKDCTDITAMLTAYCDDTVIADVTGSELQTLFVGRNTDEIADTLNQEYEKVLKD